MHAAAPAASAHAPAEPTGMHTATEPTAMHAAAETTSEAAAMAATEAAAATAAVEGESRRCKRKRRAERACDRAFEKPVHPDASVVNRRRKKVMSRAKSSRDFN